MRVLKLRCVIATDLIARGIDLPDVRVVVNIDTPLTEQELVHRVGRTGRFGGRGLAFNLVCKPGSIVDQFEITDIKEAADLVK